ncbi:hypothetical protein [Streptomyces sp. NPDC002788]
MTATAVRPYTRRISQIERGYLNAAATGTPQLIQMVVEGAGRIDPGALREAVRTATLANPGLAVRRRAGMWIADGPLPQVVELPAAHTLDAPFHHSDLDVVAGPVCEVGITEAPVTRLVVRASHIVTDGRGLRHWIGDVFRALRGEQPVGTTSAVDDTHFRAAAGVVPTAPAPARTQGFPMRLGHGPTDGTPLWIRRTVKACPSAVTARVAAAVSRCGGSGRLIIPVDLRRHDPSVRSTANLTSQLVLDFRGEETWKRLHSQIIGSLMRKREVAALDRNFMRTNPFANSLREARHSDGTRFPCTAIISDHGRIDTHGYRTDQFRPTRFFTLPMLVPYAGMFISACGFGDATELTLSCRKRPGALEASQELLDEIEHELAAAD